MRYSHNLSLFLFYVLRSAFYVLAVLPPEGVTVDAAGVSWQQPQAGVVCVHVYAADWAGDVRSTCAVETAGAARRAVAIGVGVQVDQLTAAQVRSLIAILLWQAGAIDRTGAVQPLGGWVRG